MNNKLISVKLTTTKGEEFSIPYRPINELSSAEIVCDSECPYKAVCGVLPDPRDIDNPSKNFIDLCSSLGEELGDNEKLSSSVPVAGSLENLPMFKDKKDILQILINKKHLVDINELIDRCCPGTCDLYNLEHTDCTISNKLCLYRSMFIEDKKEEP